MTVISGPREPPTPLVVQLQVWHYASQEISSEHNKQLADLFRNSDLHDWDVVPLDRARITGTNSQDRYIPVEVKFRNRAWAYNDPGEHPLSDVQELFYRIAPQFIYQFFIQIKSTPHNVNIFPTNVPKAFRARYTHALILKRLNIRVDVFVVPKSTGTNEALSWLRGAIAENALEILATIVNLYLIYQPGISRGSVFNARIFKIGVPQGLKGLRLLFQQLHIEDDDQKAQKPAHVADLHQTFNCVADPLQQYRRLTNRMQTRLTILKIGGTLSNQDLYELVQDFHTVILRFSDLKKTTRPLIDLLEETYDGDIKIYRRNRAMSRAVSSLIVTTAILCFWNPVGWAAIGAAAGGAVLAYCAGTGIHSMLDKERGKASNKKSTVRELDLAIHALDTHLKHAQAAVALVFSTQILRLPLDETIPDHKRRETLTALGVDVDAITDPVGSQVLIQDRLTRLLGGIARLHISMEDVLRDANFTLKSSEEDE